MPGCSTRARRPPQRRGSGGPAAPGDATAAMAARRGGEAARPGLRSAGLHREPAAFGFDPAVRDPGAGAAAVHDRRREPPADRGHAAARPESRGFDSNRLTAEDATPAVVGALRRRFFAALRDRDGAPPPAAARFACWRRRRRTRCACRSWRGCFPEARFIYLHRDPRQVLSSMMEAWTTGRFRTYPHLPGWTGPAWSLLLVPGWRELIGRPLHEIVAAQWHTTTRLLLDDCSRCRPSAGRCALRRAGRRPGLRNPPPLPGDARLGQAGAALPLVELHRVAAGRREVAAPCGGDRGGLAVDRGSGGPRRALRCALKKKRRPLARPPPVSRRQTGIRTRSCRAGRSTDPARRRSAGTCCRYQSCPRSLEIGGSSSRMLLMPSSTDAFSVTCQLAARSK